MAPDDWPEWLPSGWTVQITKIDQRKVKCYLDPKGLKFYSKPQVFRHLQTINNSTASEKTHNADGSTGDISLEPDVPHTNESPGSLPRGRSTKLSTGSSSKKSKETDGFLTGDGSSSEAEASQRKDGGSEWLPDGWIMEVKTRDCGSHIGMKYKCYTDPIGGRKFYSKPQVLKFLASTNRSVVRQREGDKSSTEPDKSPKFEASYVTKNKTEKKTGSIRNPFDNEIISRTPADGLPPGWIKEIRLRKRGSLKKKDPYYLDPLNGYSFFSKLDALRYLDTGDIKKCAMRPLKRDMNEEDSHNANLTGGKLVSQPDLSKGNETSKVLPNGCVVELKTKESGTKYKESFRCLTDGSCSTPDASQKDEVSEWLPDGWIMEVKVRDSGSKIGSKYKLFTDSASGRKFYSKPQVLNYLASANSTISRKRKGEKSSVEPDSSQNSEAADARHSNRSKKKKNIQKSAYNEVILTSPADGLPPGWIKETRARKYATHERRDPYYTEPLTGYIFRSKLDALRYLETGDFSKCAIKPRKRDINGKEIPVAALHGQKPVNTTTGKQLFGDKEAENSVEKQHNDVSTDAVVPTTQTLEENHTHVDFTNLKTAENTSVSTPASNRVTKIPHTKRSKSSATLPGRSSKRLKGLEPETKSDPLLNERSIRVASHGLPGAVEDKQVVSGVNVEKEGDDVIEMHGDKQVVSGVNVEKEGDDEMGDGQLSYQLGDSSWTDHCLDFAVKTLTGEIPVNVVEESVGGETSVNKTPTKVN